MADTMDKLSTVLKKAKELSEDGNVRDFINQGKSIAGDVSAYAKVKVSLSHDEEELKRTYLEIGKLYYEDNKENPQGFYIPLFDKILELNNSIELKKVESDTIKNTLLSKTKEPVEEEQESLDVIPFGDKSTDK